MTIRLKSVCITILLLLAMACGRLPYGDKGVYGKSIFGFFLLNEGQEGKRNSSLDFYDYDTGIYSKNLFADRNSDVMEELGDGGIDMGIYGTRLYVLVNRSGIVEVIDVRTGWHIDQIPVPNCRSIIFKDQYAYISSYGIDTEEGPGSQLGCVAKIDTCSLEVINTCTVGYQPEEMAIVGESLYVANSGIDRAPDYDFTVSVIDLHIFVEVMKIEVGPNLHRMEVDPYGKIWVSSRGDWYDIPSMTYVIDSENKCVCDVLDEHPCTDMAICGDSLFVYSDGWNLFYQSYNYKYDIIDVKTHAVINTDFIADGVEQQFSKPSGIAVNPQTREIFITDAGDGYTPGKLYCFSKDGHLKWSTYTGYNPSRIVFTRIPLL